MSAYCTQDDILAEINAADLLPMLDDNNTNDPNDPSVTGRLASIIARESKKIDGRLSNIYNVPFNPVPPAVNDACIVFVCEALYRRRLTPDEKNPFHVEAEDLRKRFTKIGNGELELDLNFPRDYPQGTVTFTPIVMNGPGVNSL